MSDDSHSHQLFAGIPAKPQLIKKSANFDNSRLEFVRQVRMLVGLVAFLSFWASGPFHRKIPSHLRFAKALEQPVTADAYQEDSWKFWPKPLLAGCDGIPNHQPWCPMRVYFFSHGKEKPPARSANRGEEIEADFGRVDARSGRSAPKKAAIFGFSNDHKTRGPQRQPKERQHRTRRVSKSSFSSKPCCCSQKNTHSQDCG
jgi:hypothetical protein